MRFSQLVDVCGGHVLAMTEDHEVVYLATDSRKAIPSAGTLFFAIRGQRHDAHRFLNELYKAGIRQFVVEQDIDSATLPGANLLQVTSSVDALQRLAAHHRASFRVPVLGITGSNGKTIIKEWLYQLLSVDFSICKNPGSYNSQIGVPLSVWQLQDYHDLAIFEAGISQPGEMGALARIIRPTAGLYTNIGPAHDEGFKSRQEKIREKMKLFQSAQTLIFCRDHTAIFEEVERSYRGRTFTWGVHPDSDVHLQHWGADGAEILFDGEEVSLAFPFTDRALQENALHAVAVMLWLKVKPAVIQSRLRQLRAVPMRLEMKQGINQCQLIDDTYNNDLGGLHISLDFLASLQKKNKTVILSDVLQSGRSGVDWVTELSRMLAKAGVNRFIGIGEVLSANRAIISGQVGRCEFYSSVSAFVEKVDFNQFDHEVILVKGARSFQFEKIVSLLQRKVHGTVMEIDLEAMVHNLNFFRSRLRPGVKLMAMVKAFAYGSGSEEIGNLLQFHKVDYLGVAYPDEGVELRKNHIRLPIMVMNASAESLAACLKHDLEPEVFSRAQLEEMVQRLDGRVLNIHLKFDTGMHRLGFVEGEWSMIFDRLKELPNVRVASVFTHLAAADESQHDEFSREQLALFERACSRFESSMGYRPLRHALNSPGILRFPEGQLDMVRLGIGLYGINPTTEFYPELKPVATLKSVVSQVKIVNAGDTIGYGRRGTTARPTTTATIAIGYADGFSRAFSRGKGAVWIKGRLAPVIGNVCMDMAMVDVTGMDVRAGDEVIIFGPELPITEVAARIDTIPYEILTATSERVKRVYYAASI
ncbi:MAG: bifunctional UDP-N-acetylmuramoyl-tripeptide:D-alanyl-D-alanine ligase/alanine racemase [Cyclobacteriaceae bacterium]